MIVLKVRNFGDFTPYRLILLFFLCLNKHQMYLTVLFFSVSQNHRKEKAKLKHF